MKLLKKRDLAVLCGILAVVLILGGVLLSVMIRYRNQGLAQIWEFDGAYTYNGKLLISEDGSRAKYYSSLGRDGFGDDLPLQTLDLTPFGFAGESYSYYRVELQRFDHSENAVGVKYWFGQGEEYEGFWPVSNPEKFVYLASDGKKYLIHPESDLCYPMFAGSVEGVDEYGKDVVAFSANGSYAVGISGEVVTVYHTDPMNDSLRIVDFKTVSFGEYGAAPSFGAFVGNQQAYFSLKNGNGEEVLVALDCPTATVAPAALSPNGEYGEVLNRLYVQRMNPEKDNTVVWSHRLLGTETVADLPESVDKITLTAVSPNGTYAVGRAEEEIWVLSAKRSFSLSSILQEGEEVQWVDFVYENVLSVSLKRSDGTTLVRTYKICF